MVSDVSRLMGNDIKRKRRLAEALRDNLMKRKAQRRAKIVNGVSDNAPLSEKSAPRPAETQTITSVAEC